MKKLLIITTALTAIGIVVRAIVQLVKSERKNYRNNNRSPKLAEIKIDLEELLNVSSRSFDKDKSKRFSNVDNQLAQNVIRIDRGLSY